MHAQNENLLSRDQIPEADGFVVAAAHEPHTAGQGLEAAHQGEVAYQGLLAPAIIAVEDTDAVAICSTGDSLSVRKEDSGNAFRFCGPGGYFRPIVRTDNGDLAAIDQGDSTFVRTYGDALRNAQATQL